MANERNGDNKNQFPGMSDNEIRAYLRRRGISKLRNKIAKNGGRDTFARKNGFIMR